MVTVEEINDVCSFVFVTFLFPPFHSLNTQDEEYRDILSDIFTECSKFGSLQDVKIPRRKDGHQRFSFFAFVFVFVHFLPLSFCSEGSVFLKYTSPQDAMNVRRLHPVFFFYAIVILFIQARNALSGKKFNNNTITTAFYDEGRFGQNILG